jgi:hypothetical protein
MLAAGNADGDADGKTAPGRARSAASGPELAEAEPEEDEPKEAEPEEVASAKRGSKDRESAAAAAAAFWGEAAAAVAESSGDRFGFAPAFEAGRCEAPAGPEVRWPGPPAESDSDGASSGGDRNLAAAGEGWGETGCFRADASRPETALPENGRADDARLERPEDSSREDSASDASP